MKDILHAMLNIKTKETVIEVVVFLIVFLFLYAAGSKLVDYKRFTSQLGLSPLLTNFAGLIAWSVPTVEIIISLMLIIPRFRMIGLYAAFGLMTIFTFYIIAILTISDDVPCSCGGILSMLGWREHLIFNTVFVLMSLTAIILTDRIEIMERSFQSKKTQ